MAFGPPSLITATGTVSSTGWSAASEAWDPAVILQCCLSALLRYGSMFNAKILC